MDDRIERLIVIGAPVERVWDLVTRPGWWVPSDVEAPYDRTPGHRTVRESARFGRFAVEVEQIEPQTYAAFRWASAFPGEELASGRTTLVEFTLEAGAAGVTVTVAESGFSWLDLAEAERRAAFEGNTTGWGEQMAALKASAEETSTA
jgi:uncharacterized protein YndB with AHSA1/START domain